MGEAGQAGQHQCQNLSIYKKDESKKDEYEYENTTIRQLIKDIIKKDLQDSEKSRAPEAVQKLQGDISFIEKEYDAIPQLVAAYEQFYPDLKEPGVKYCTAERQWTSIKEWADNATLCPKIKDAIADLRSNSYQNDTDEDFNSDPTHPKSILDTEEKDFLSIKSCYDQRKEEEESITKIYAKKKDLKKTIEDWLGGLKTLYEKANDYNMKKKYRSLYAVYLEAYQVWKKIKHLSPTKQETTQAAPTTSSTDTSTTPEPQDPEWFKKDLTEYLKKSLIAKHELFCWYDDLLKKQKTLAKAKEAYDTFTSSRQNNFLREAEDVVPPKAEAPPHVPPKQEPTPTPYSA